MKYGGGYYIWVILHGGLLIGRDEQELRSHFVYDEDLFSLSL